MDHYQYNGQQTPPVNRNSYGNQIWYIWGPIRSENSDRYDCIRCGIGSDRGSIYDIRHYGLSAQMTDYAQQIANIYQKDYVQILKAVDEEGSSKAFFLM